MAVSGQLECCGP